MFWVATLQTALKKEAPSSQVVDVSSSKDFRPHWDVFVESTLSGAALNGNLKGNCPCFDNAQAHYLVSLDSKPHGFRTPISFYECENFLEGLYLVDLKKALLTSPGISLRPSTTLGNPERPP